MHRLIRGLLNAGFFLLCFAQVPLAAGYYLLGDCVPAIGMLIALLPLSFLLSLLPGRVGGGRHRGDEPVVLRTAHGGDPDPDRALRSEALPLPERRAFPLRALVCLLACLGVVAVVYFLPTLREVWWVMRLIMGAVMAAMLPLALKVVALDDGGAGSVTAGFMLYAIAGVAAFFDQADVLNNWLLGFGLTFMLCCAFSLNNQSMSRGAAALTGARLRPPARMRRQNRLMILGVAAVGAAVLYFDRIRTATITATRQLVIWIMQAFVWLSNLLMGSGTETGSGGSPAGEADMLAGLGGGESNPFWKAMEKVAVVLAIVVGAAALYLAFRRIWKLLVVLGRRIAARLRKLTDAVSEDYHDEQESLFDWGETRREMGETLKKRLARLTRREKKWEQMDTREQVRYVVRSLYRRAPEKERLGSLTIREAAPLLHAPVAEETLTALYDQARYGEQPPAAQQVGQLRKDAKV